MHSSLILAPFLSILLLNIPPLRITKGLAFWVCLALSLLQVGLIIFPAYCTWGNQLDLFGKFLKFNFVLDSLSRLMLLCIGIVLAVTLSAAKNIITDPQEEFNFANLALIILTGLNGVVMVRDIFSLYLFIEITAVSSYILIAFQKDILSLEGAFKYIVLSTIATMLMLSGIALILLISGGTDFSLVRSSLGQSPYSFFIMFALGLFLCGLFIKAGLFPFCGWLPDAYQAAFPPAGILMAGIVTKVVGVYALMRLVSSVFPFYYSLNLILMAVGVASVLFGALTCLTQNNFRRMLAYSSISQVGYIILGLGCGTTLGLAGAAFHLFNHAIFKSLLFINSQAVESQTGTNDMDKLSGLATRMPITGFSSIIGSLAVAGIPPLSGFWSKLIIVIALWSSGHHAISIIAILTSVITLAYFLSMQRRVFFGSLNDNFINIREAGLALTLPSLLLTAIILGIGIYFPRLLNTAIFPLATISGG